MGRVKMKSAGRVKLGVIFHSEGQSVNQIKSNQIKSNQSINLLRTRDGRISDPAIRIWPDFHYLAKSATGQIACYMLDRIAANYCVSISQAICGCSLSLSD